MEFNVTRLKHGLVPPSEPTPSGVLDLSVIDRHLVIVNYNVQTLLVFKFDAPMEVIRRALYKTLVHYYPIAGRMTFHNPARAQISCSGEGIWFVEACADQSLEEMKYFEDAKSVPTDKLLPTHPNEADGLDPLVLLQITKFKCDGFVMGLTFRHAIFDGLGVAQFLKAIGEMALCEEKLSITPCWSRDLIQSLSLETYLSSIPSLPPPPTYRLENAIIDIPMNFINRQKKLFKAQNEGPHCSSFEIVAASFWKHRTFAISNGLSEDTVLKLIFFANCRPFVSPPLPTGYYGNYIFPVTITASVGLLKRGSITQVVKLIQTGKENVSSEFNKWINNGLVQGVDPFIPPVLYTTLCIMEWGRLGLNNNDDDDEQYPITHVVPIQGSLVYPIGDLGFLPSPHAGFRLTTRCVEKIHLQSLTQWHTYMEKEYKS